MAIGVRRQYGHIAGTLLELQRSAVIVTPQAGHLHLDLPTWDQIAAGIDRWEELAHRVITDGAG